MTSFDQSNIANFGSALNTKVNFDKAQQEAAWSDAGKTVGVQVWRIEKFSVKPSTTPLGTFHSGDCYIILNTYKPNLLSAKLSHNLHFWLGRDSSQDERGAAAYKAVELDDVLHGAPVQYREVQQHESPVFLALFEKHNLMYLDGGIDSGFEHVKATVYPKRLLHIQGRKPSRVIDITNSKGFKLTSLNADDCFLIDDGLKLIQLHGPHTHADQKHAVRDVAQSLNESRNGKCHLSVVDGLASDVNSGFWSTYFGVADAPKMLASTADNRQADELAGLASPKSSGLKSIIRLKADSGKLEVTQIAKDAKTITRSQLTEDDVFLVDTGAKLIFVFVGAKASVVEKANAMQFATKYMDEHKLPSTTAVVRIVSGSETPEFNKTFA